MKTYFISSRQSNIRVVLADKCAVLADNRATAFKSSGEEDQ